MAERIDAVGEPNRASARALLMTLLGEFVLPAAGHAWTAHLVGALGLAGVEERAARQAIARTATAGWLINDRVGRQVRWHLSDPAIRMLREGTERIYGFGRHIAAWDRQWLLLFLALPESRRDLRYRLRVQLRWAGFATTGNGVWLSPWTDREPEAARIVEALGITSQARTFLGPLGRLGDPRSLLADAWDLVALDRTYRDFITRHHGPLPVDGRRAFASLTRLVHDWRRFPGLDPGLPAELLPDPWAGRAATELFHQRHGELAPAAHHWWAQETNPNGSSLHGLDEVPVAGG